MLTSLALANVNAANSTKWLLGLLTLSHINVAYVNVSDAS